MKRFLVIVFCLFFYSTFAWATCDTTVESNTSGTAYICGDNETFTVNSGVTVSHTSNSRPVDANNQDNVTIDNYGTITNTSKNGTIDIQNSSNITIYNRSGALMYSEKSGTIKMSQHDGDVSIYNEGTIHAYGHGAIHNYARPVAGDIYIENSGTIKTTNDGVGSSHTGRHLASISIEGDTSFTGSFTLVNTGTIEVLGTQALPALRVNNAYANIITTSGTISGGPEQSDTYAGMDIVIDKCSDATNMDVCEGKDETTTINLDGEPTFSKGLDLNGTKVNIVLKKGLKRDVTIRIFDYVEESSDYLTITSEGLDTYTLSSETLTFDDGSDNLDGSSYNTRNCDSQTFVGYSDSCTVEKYNAGTDGILTILGEDLEVEKNNQKYRAENTLTKIRGLFGAANYLGGQWPDNCTTVDPKKTGTELNKTCSNRFVKLFHSYQKREGVYDGTSTGIIGILSPIYWKGYPIVSNLFVGYSNQSGDFDNGEYLGGDNYVLGLKNTYEHKGFKASFAPMIGVNDLGVKDYDADKVEVKATDFLSEFAALNGKINKKIETGEDNYLNISVEGTYGLQRFPEYISKFTDGDLSVDESIEQLLSGGFEVSYLEEIPGNFVIKPYIGVSLNRNLNNTINITARNKNADVSNDHQETWSGYHAGVSFTKEAKDMNFDLDLMYGNEDGLINQIAAVSLTKSFGQSETTMQKTETAKDLKVAGVMPEDMDLLEFGELKKLNDKLKIENERLRTENEKLKVLSKKAIKENKASKQLIVELLKENEKIKLEKEIFKNKILENENKELREKIETKVTEDEVNRFALFLFITILILMAYGITSFVVSISQAIFKNKQY